MSTFILVHGGAHAGWCWDRLIEPLEGGGHRVVAVDLPGHGPDEAAAALVTLDDYLEVVTGTVAAAAEAGDPVVLVGHSMGGVTVSAVAERMPGVVSAVAFLSAIVPDPGGAGLPKLQEGAGESALLEEGVMAFSADQATVSVEPARAAAVFYNRCSPEDASWAVAQLGPEPVAPMATPVPLTDGGFGAVAKRYLGGIDDRCVPPRLQRAIAGRWGMEVEELDADHTPMLSMPGDLAARLLKGS